MSATVERRVRISSTVIESVAELKERLVEFAGCDGWVQYASTCVVHRANAAPTRAPAGLPLAAEFVRGAVSVLLRREGDGWRWTEATLDEGDVVCRVRRARFISTEPGLALEYRVLWRRDESRPPVQPWSPWLGLFVGWSREEKAS
jgi:hypothetical protein